MEGFPVAGRCAALVLGLSHLRKVAIDGDVEFNFWDSK
jgi:hypothetical protein